MNKILYAATQAWQTGRSRRRLRLWALAVTTIILALTVQAVFPDLRWIRGVAGDLEPTTTLLVFLAALCCEFIDSSLGMGYGTTLTPLLLLAGFQPLQIVPCVLLSEAVTGLGAGLMHHRDGNVDFIRDRRARATAVWLSVLSVFGALAAVAFAVRVPKQWLTAIIAIIVLSVGVVTLATFRRQLRYRRSHMIALGAVAAFNKGLSGGGYGPLVTAGQVVSGMSAKHAVAITSLAEAWTCMVGLAAYSWLHGALDWGLALPLTVGASLSVPIATLTVRRVHEVAMRCSVGVVTFILGLATLVSLFR